MPSLHPPYFVKSSSNRLAHHQHPVVALLLVLLAIGIFFNACDAKQNFAPKSIGNIYRSKPSQAQTVSSHQSKSLKVSPVLPILPQPDFGESQDIDQVTITPLMIEENIDLLGTSPTHAPTTKVSTPTNYDFHPPPCINDESEIVHVNGVLSPALTFMNCLNNIADPYSIPTYYNGSVQGTMIVYNSVQLNNLQGVS